MRTLGISAPAGVLAASLVVCVSNTASPVQRPVNVVLVTIDTVRADHLSAYGYKRQTSPNLDRLAREGALFETAYSATNSTQPSHTSLLTGTRATTHGVLSNSIRFARADIPTLAERFHRAGYATAAVVSTPELNRDRSGLGRGFDFYADTPQITRPAAAASALARSWIAQHHGHPFFFWLHLIDAHMPYSPPPPYDARFVSERCARIDVILGRESADEFFRDHPHVRRRAFLKEQFARPFIDSIGLNHIGLTPKETDYLAAMYDGEIAYANAALGVLFTDLRKLSPERPPLVVVTADHGESLGDHHVVYCEHSTIYEETLRVPLIFWWPGHIPAGSRIATIAAGIDVAPIGLDTASSPSRCATWT
jgi:arylsulfatase